jgi:hypothetical protein
MKLFEIVAIQRQNGTALTGRKGKNFVIRDFLSGVSCCLHRQYVMSEGTEAFNDREWILFIGVESGHV